MSPCVLDQLRSAPTYSFHPPFHPPSHSPASSSSRKLLVSRCVSTRNRLPPFWLSSALSLPYLAPPRRVRSPHQRRIPHCALAALQTIPTLPHSLTLTTSLRAVLTPSQSLTFTTSLRAVLTLPLRPLSWFVAPWGQNTIN